MVVIGCRNGAAEAVRLFRLCHDLRRGADSFRPAWGVMGAIIDGKAVTAVFTQPRIDGSFPSGLAEYLNAISLRRPVLLFAFAPKAAGTFLRSAAIDAVGGQLVRIGHA